tara:strand:- start:2081 stop:2788 length:708 start_codon:yes stop_codon:yes gene_type:complete
MIDWKSYGPIYTVAPGIKKIENLPIIEFDDHENRYLKLKRKSKENVYYDKLFSLNHDRAICERFYSILSNEYPERNFKFSNFQELGFNLQEDLAIFHRTNKLIALHVSFPSVWVPKEKIGLSFKAIHSPVPGMENFLKNENKYVQMMVDATTPIIRYVWGEHYGYFLCEEEPLSPDTKVMHTERQTFIGMPDQDIGIFLIRKKVMLYEETAEDFKDWYKKQVSSMTDEQKKYKIK